MTAAVIQAVQTLLDSTNSADYASNFSALKSAMEETTFASDEEVQEACDLYGSDEIEIDPEALISVAEDGLWVQAWVWLDRPSIEDGPIHDKDETNVD